MKEFNVEVAGVETVLALETFSQAQAERQYPAYIGLDTHKVSLVIYNLDVTQSSIQGRAPLRGYSALAESMEKHQW